MRTRKQGRNFGQDITNFQNELIPHQSLGRKNRKPQPSNQAQESQMHPNIIDETKKITFQFNFIEPIDEIFVFAYSYFHKINGTSMYIGLTSNNCKSIQLPIAEKQYPNVPMFPKSPNLTISMRSILVEWLIEVHYKMGLSYQTLYLTIFLVDKYSSRRNVHKNQYQLLAMSCLFIAGKYEEVATPKLKKIITLCDKLYNSGDVLRMQSEVLLELNFCISQPSLNWFIGIQLFAIVEMNKNQGIGSSCMQKFKRVCYYTTELCLFEVHLLLRYSPQVISNTIVYATSMKSQFIEINVKISTKYLNENELKEMRECTSQIRKIFASRGSKKYDAVNNKYPDLITDGLL